jgi:hypothetical protein
MKYNKKVINMMPTILEFIQLWRYQMADTTKTYTLPSTAEEIENLLKSVS